MAGSLERVSDSPSPTVTELYNTYNSCGLSSFFSDHVSSYGKLQSLMPFSQHFLLSPLCKLNCSTITSSFFSIS